MRAWVLKNSGILHVFWAVVIAIVLWLQVHGEGEGTLSMDAPLQVQGLSEPMMIVNDFPDTVRITVSGVQSRLHELRPQDVHVSIDASALTSPIVTDLALKADNVALPAGLKVEKILPDRIQLQIDRVVKRDVPVTPRFELPETWQVKGVVIEPAQMQLSGPEVWLEGLIEVQTAPIKLDLQPGVFEVTVDIESPTAKAIRLVHEKAQVTIRGMLITEVVEDQLIQTEGDTP
ncbi:MAG: CdaR family protein [Mariprofundaceae bacterium]